MFYKYSIDGRIIMKLNGIYKLSDIIFFDGSYLIISSSKSVNLMLLFEFLIAKSFYVNQRKAFFVLLAKDLCIL